MRAGERIVVTEAVIAAVPKISFLQSMGALKCDIEAHHPWFARSKRTAMPMTYARKLDAELRAAGRLMAKIG